MIPKRDDDHGIHPRQVGQNIGSYTMPFQLRTYAEQVAEHLRSEILSGRWAGELPGEDRLGAELNVNHTTVGTAIRQLEREGLLVNRGAGRPRGIRMPKNAAAPSLRIAMLLYEGIDRKLDYMVDLQHRLIEAGHVPTIPSKALVDLKMDAKRVAGLVGKTRADAWVIQSGSTEVLEWFSRQGAPAFAFAGRRRGVKIAGSGPDKLPAARIAVRRLFELGHRRIVMLAREERRKPIPGQMERSFIQELQSLGIPTGPYNLPDWDDTADGLYRLLGSLFCHTPPTALIIDEVPLYLAVEIHLARLGLLAPESVSLLCLDPSPVFRWHRPSVAHISWDSRPVINQIVKWADQVARGRDDRRQTFTKAEFVEGGSFGPVPR
jgi:DNA-binding transcriptional regulator YhcF (GntR family)